MHELLGWSVGGQMRRAAARGFALAAICAAVLMAVLATAASAATTVTAQGAWFDLRDQSTRGDRESSVVVCWHSDTAVTHVGFEGEEVSVWETVLPGGTDGCSQPLDVDAPFMTQGAHTFHVAVKRNLQQLGQSEPWTVIIDRRPPSFPSSFMVTASLESSSRTAIIDWDAAGDPTPQDGGGEPGPAAGYRVRYRHPGGTFSAWQDTALERVEIPNSFAGDLFDLEIVPRDAAGNLGSVMAAQVRVEGEGTHCQATANGVPSDCFDDVEPGPKILGLLLSM